MNNREDVIKWLELENECAADDHTWVRVDVLKNALALLKESEKVVHCSECRYSKEIDCLDWETGEKMLGCTNMVAELNEDGYVMTVKPDSYCSWGCKR